VDFLFEGLNENQKKAVLHKDGPLLVLAGAGAGKTRAISHRVAYLVHQGVDPEKILAITFTNKAAAEMRERITALLRRLPANDLFDVGLAVGLAPEKKLFAGRRLPFVSTFHSLGVSILKRHGAGVGVSKNFSIFDQNDSLSLIKDAIKEMDLDDKQFQPSRVQSIISRYKGDLITSDAYRETVGNEFFPRFVSQIWDKYEAELQNQKALDFDDLILKTYLLLKNNTEAREFYQELWHYIVIDEYQDTNKGQYEISKLLAAKHKNICIIGDIDQAIYSWRGADFRNIINFERDFPNHTSIVFEENYRSTKNILEAAAKVIERNKMRKPKNVIAIKEEGAGISLYEAMNEKEEAEFVIHTIKDILEGGGKPPEIAILYRANFQSRVFEEEFLKHRIPYQVLGVRFYERKEVKDIFSFIRAALNQSSLVDIKRVINVPPRGIGKTSILNFFAGKKLPGEMQKKFDEFMANLTAIKNVIEKEKPSEVIKFIMQKTGYQDFLKNGNDDDKERLENLMELVSIASRYDELPAPEGVEKLLTDASLMSDQDNLLKNQDAVRLMTAHAAKGLEFEYVFIVGLEDGLFPHSGFGQRDPEREEEERRLFYVALTRAKEKLFLTFSVSRTVFGARQMNMPSRFLSDIPEHLLKLENYEKEQEYIEYL
jgi:DNA helicase-2/ATP-dependent DNA helicase PcrA